MNSNDLDILLSEFREKNPGDLKTRKWKNAVNAELAKARPARSKALWLQLTAAVVIGFLLGGLYFKSGNSDSVWLAQNNFSGDATSDFTLTKSE